MTARRLLAALDDEALATLASRGLLRRAGKDLEGGLVTALEDLPDGGVRAQVDGMAVTVPPGGITAALCGCKASGACRHLLAVALACREAASLSDPRDELAALDLGALQGMVGRAAARAALELAETATGVAVRAEPGAVLVHWPGEAYPIRFLAGGGFAGMISRIPQARRPALHAAAVLAWRRAVGLPLGDAATLAAAAPAGLSEGEQAFLDSAECVLHDLLRLGLAAIAEVSRERVATLAVSARAEHLPRLAAALRSLAAMLEALAARRVDAATGEALARMARVAALIEALRRAPPRSLAALRGSHRAAYRSVPPLDLVPVIGHRWRARGGTEGVRLLFWAPQRGDWLEWSQPKLERAGIDPAARFTTLGPWPPLAFAGVAGQARLQLSGGAIGAGRRLSAGEAVAARLLSEPWLAPGERFGAADVADWPAVRAWMAQRIPVGLAGDEDRGSDVVVLRPAAWGRRVFDSAAQALLCPVLDRGGGALTLRVPYTPVTATRIQILERCPDALLAGAAVVCGVTLSGADGWLEPLGLVRPAEPRVIHLDFPPVELSGPAAAPAPATTMAPPPPLHPCAELVVLIAEAGLAGGVSDSLRQRAAALSGELLAQGLERPSALLARISGGNARPATVLALAWQNVLLERLALRRAVSRLDD